MPYAERFQLVHVAIPKTGTTSVVRALQNLHDIHGGELTLVKDRIDATFRARYGLDALGDKQPGRAKHLSAIQLKTILGQRWDRAFSFSIVRNPWARTVSRYYFTHADNAPSEEERSRRGTGRTFHTKSFPRWLRDRVSEAERKGGLRNQIEKLTDLEGRVIVDFVGRLDSVSRDFATVCERVGVPPIEVPHLNGTGRGARYTELYDAETRELVRELYRRDIETYGFEYGR